MTTHPRVSALSGQRIIRRMHMHRALIIEAIKRNDVARAAGAAVRISPLPDRVNVTAAYAAVVVRQAHDPAAAADFVAWLAGADGRAVLAPFGFAPPP